MDVCLFDVQKNVLRTSKCWGFLYIIVKHNKMNGSKQFHNILILAIFFLFFLFLINFTTLSFPY